MKLLVVGSYGSLGGGVGTVIKEVVDHSSSKFSEILVISPRMRKQSKNNAFSRGNIQVVSQPCGYIPGIAGSADYIRKIRVKRKLNSLSFSPNVIWCHTPADFHALYDSKFRSVPKVYTVHGIWGRFYSSEMKIKWKKSLFIKKYYDYYIQWQKLALKLSKITVTYSSYLRERTLKNTPSADVRIISNGVNTDLFRPQKLRRKNVILYVGRMAIAKGIPILIQAMNKVLAIYSEWELWLVGGAFDQKKDFFLSLSDKRVLKRIKFLGTVPNRDVPELINSAKIFVMPTIRDGFEIALMEAVATGIPTVTTADYERAELYGSVSSLVRAGNIEELAQSIIEIIENYSSFCSPEEVEKRVNYSQKFSWEKIAESYSSVFKEACAKV